MTDYRGHSNYPDPQPPGPGQPWPGPDGPEWEPHPGPPPKHPSPLIWWILIALGAVLLLCSGILIAVFSGGDSKPQPAFIAAAPSEEPVASAPSADQPPATYQIGKTFRSGDFQYTIHGVETGVSKVGKEYVEKKAQGAYTKIDLTVKNMSDRQMFFDTAGLVRVEDKDGRRFNSSTDANVVGNDDGETGWLMRVNPGNAVRVAAYFDMPKTVVATRVVVSASMLDFEADAIIPVPPAPPR